MKRCFVLFRFLERTVHFQSSKRSYFFFHCLWIVRACGVFKLGRCGTPLHFQGTWLLQLFTMQELRGVAHFFGAWKEMGVRCALTPNKKQPHEFSTSFLLSELLFGRRHCRTLQTVKQVIGKGGTAAYGGGDGQTLPFTSICSKKNDRNLRISPKYLEYLDINFMTDLLGNSPESSPLHSSVPKGGLHGTISSAVCYPYR